MNIARASKAEDAKSHFQKCFMGTSPQKWSWKYEANPFFLRQGIPAWIAVSDGKTVGHFGAIPVKLKVASSRINAAWAVDFVILPDYRRKGLGMSLVEEANRHFDAFLAIGGTHMSSSLFVKMGWVFLGRAPYYIKILDIGIPIVNPFIKFYNYLTRPRQPKGIKVDIIENFSEEADLFWKEIENFYRIVVPRDKAYLNWKYGSQPGMNYIKFRCVRAGRICGYIVTRILKSKSDNTEGLIADIIARPDDKDAIRGLIFAALRYLKSKNCSVARCCVNNKDIQRILGEFGFIRRKPQMSFLVKKNLDGL